MRIEETRWPGWLLASIGILLLLLAASLTSPALFGFHRTAELGEIRQEAGYEYSAPMPPGIRPVVRRDVLFPEMPEVFEDGVALREPVLSRGDIAEAGRGRYRIQSGRVWFSTSDGGAPGERSYQVRSSTFTTPEWLLLLLWGGGGVFCAAGVAAFRERLAGTAASRWMWILAIAYCGGLFVALALRPFAFADAMFLRPGLPLLWAVGCALLLRCGGRLAVGLCLATAALPAFATILHYAVAGMSHPWFLVGGALPWSDAFQHFVQAAQIHALGQTDAGFNGRFFYPLFFASVLGASGQNVHLAHFLSLLLLLWLAVFFLRVSPLKNSFTACAAFLFLFWMYVRVHCAGLVMTEVLGLALGVCGAGFLFLGAGSGRRAAFLGVLGLFFFSLGMVARPGALFVLPCLGAFLVWKFGLRETWKGWIGALPRVAMISVVVAATVLCAFGLNRLASEVVFTGKPAAFQNFAFSFHGLVTGTDWSVSHDGGRGEPSKILQESFELLKNDPSVLGKGLLRAAGEVFPRGFFFRFGDEVRLAVGASLLAVGGILFCLISPRLRASSAWALWALPGLLISIPFAPPWDAGVRPYAATVALQHFFVALGAWGAVLLAARAGEALLRIFTAAISGREKETLREVREMSVFGAATVPAGSGNPPPQMSVALPFFILSALVLVLLGLGPVSGFVFPPGKDPGFLPGARAGSYQVIAGSPFPGMVSRQRFLEGLARFRIHNADAANLFSDLQPPFVLGADFDQWTLYALPWPSNRGLEKTSLHPPLRVAPEILRIPSKSSPLEPPHHGQTLGQ